MVMPVGSREGRIRTNERIVKALLTLSSDNHAIFICLHESFRYCMRTIYLICYQSFPIWCISLQWYLLHRVMLNDHWKPTSAAPWSNSVSVTSHWLTLKGICQLCSKQWHGSYYWYFRPSQWQKQLFRLTCVILVTWSMKFIYVRIVSLWI